MKIKEGYVLREVAKQIVVVPIGKEALNFNGIITLNKTGKFLWELLQQETKIDQLVEALCDAYEVDQETASKDVEAFISILDQNKLLIHE